MSDSVDQKNAVKDLFLEKLAETGNATEAARVCKIGRRTAYNWRTEDAAFAAAWDDALAMATDSLVHEARRRAMDGIEEVRYFKGEPVGSFRRYSDQLLMFLLRSYRPDIYRVGFKRDATKSEETIGKSRDVLFSKMEKLAGGNDAGKPQKSDRKPDRNGN